MSQITENVRKIENREKIEQAWIGALQCSELVSFLREGCKKKMKKMVEQAEADLCQAQSIFNFTY